MNESPLGELTDKPIRTPYQLPCYRVINLKPLNFLIRASHETMLYETFPNFKYVYFTSLMKLELSGISPLTRLSGDLSFGVKLVII